MAKKRTKKAKAAIETPSPASSDQFAAFVLEQEYVRGKYFTPVPGAVYRFDYDKLLWEAENALPNTPEGVFERQKIYRWYTRNDLFFCIHNAMDFQHINQAWLVARCAEIESDDYMSMDLWAREHFKTTIITIGETVQYALKYPEDTQAVFSHSTGAARTILRAIKTYLESKKLISWFPDILWEDVSKAKSWGLETGLTVQRTSARREATIEAAGIVEGLPTGNHYNRRIIDDLVDPDSVTTPEQIRKTREGYQQSHNLGSSTILGARDLRRVVGTPYSWADLYAELEETARYNVRKYTVYGETKSEYTAGRDGVLLSAKKIENKLLDQGQYIFNCQQLMNPTPEKQQKVHSDWIQFYQALPARHNLNVYIVGDPANTKKSHKNNDPDRTSIWVFGAAARGYRYLLDGAYGRFSFLERWAILKGLVTKWDPKTVGWELYGKDTENDTMRLWMDEQNFRFNLVDLGGPMGKNERIKQWLIPRINRKQWLFPMAIWVDDEDTNQKINLVDILINKEMLPWPLIRKDDMFDCLSRAEDPALMVEEPYENQSMTKVQETAALAEIGKQYAEVPGL